ncbi:MAG TPA: adenylate/guanylate cyclase domain-containing protein [Solirubrobacteraceae bacterium]|nr:adenylate/guanylate cyclase domain-containing protein [Solirubrobacteraceae bacterium]
MAGRGERQPPGSLVRERRQALPQGEVSLLFTDIEGSTRLLNQLGDAYGEVLAEHRRLLREVWARHGGVEVDTEGDAFFVAFALARAAVAAAADAQSVLGSADLEGLRVRIGVHTGTPRIRDDDYWGTDVHYAARICAAAHGGQVLLSAATRALVGDADVEDLGQHALKDFPAPRHIFHLLAGGQPSSAFAPIRSVRTGETNLPDQISSFIGRDGELATLRDLVARGRIVSLVGAGGVGKTRLALRLGAELLDGSGDGVWLVELAALRDANLVGQTIANVLRLSGQSGRPIADTISSAVADRELLLILDNCEHLIDTVAELVRELVVRCSGLEVVVTSRQPLGIAGEQVYRVPSLSVPGPDTTELEEIESSEAVQLFVERVRQQRPGFALTEENAVTAARVCRRLDGIALALELAAVRLRSLGVEQLDARLDRRFHLLRGSTRGGALPRQQTLEALIDWSYQLLDESEREALMVLSTFAAAGFDLPAAEAVCGAAGLEDVEVFDHVDALVDKSLVQAEDTAGHVRYRLLDTVREYAAAKLSDRPNHAARARIAHRDHYLRLAETIRPRLFGPEAPQALDQLALDHDNLRRALTESLGDPDPRPGLRLAVAIRLFWRRRGHAVEGFHVLSDHLERAGAQEPTIERGYALASRALLASSASGDARAAVADAEEALRIARDRGDEGLTVEALRQLSNVLVYSGAFASIPGIAEEGLALARPVNASAALIDLLGAQAVSRLEAGLDGGQGFEEAHRIALAAGDAFASATALGNLGSMAMSQGDVTTARRHHAAVLELLADLGDVSGEMWTNYCLGIECQSDGSRAEAVQRFSRALELSVRLGDAWLISSSLRGLSLTASDPDTAAVLHGSADVITEELAVAPPEVERRIREDHEQHLKETLGIEQYEAACERGRRLPRREAVALALGAPSRT